MKITHKDLKSVRGDYYSDIYRTIWSMLFPKALKIRFHNMKRSVGIRHNFEIHKTTIPYQSLNHSIYSVSVRQLYEKLERRDMNSYSSFPVLGSEGYEVGLPSSGGQVRFALSNNGTNCQTTITCSQAPGQQSPSFMLILAFYKQPAADPDCRDRQHRRELFSTILTSLAQTGFIRE